MDVNSINRILVETIHAIIDCPYEYSDQADKWDHLRLTTLGEISGALELANRLKEALQNGSADDNI